LDSQPERQINSLGQILAKAQHFMNSERQDMASATLREGLVHHPESAYMHGLLAITLLNQGLIEECRESIAEALRCDPEDLNSHYGLSRLAIQEGRHADGEKHLLEGLRIHPENVPFLIEYARLMSLTKQKVKADKLLAKALTIDPNNEIALSMRSRVKAERAHFISADRHRTKSLEVNPDSATVHIQAGAGSLQSGRPFRARRHFREALQIDPNIQGLEEAYQQADRCCRWTYLPLYYWGLLIQRVPGRQFTVYLGFLVVAFMLPSLGVPGGVTMPVIYGYLGFCVYTWIANPLTNLWLKWRPLR
jgi:tetratricopeptide (TPR) repeat protein